MNNDYMEFPYLARFLSKHEPKTLKKQSSRHPRSSTNQLLNHIMLLENKITDLEKNMQKKKKSEKKRKKKKYPNPFILHFMMETFLKNNAMEQQFPPMMYPPPPHYFR